MTLNVSEQAQPQASKALSETQKAPFEAAEKWNEAVSKMGAA
ncbi:hypothetical protein [Xylella fastidiosa]